MNKKDDGKTGTAYRYNPDGSVTHTVHGRRLSTPLSPEEAGGEPWRTAVGTEEYLTKKLAHPSYAGDPALARAQARADEAGMPRIAVPAMLGQLLTILAKTAKAEKVLEIGTLAGVSTSFLATALPAHGRIDTIEYSPQHAKIAQANFLDMDLCPFPTMHVGKALDLLRDPKGAFASPPGTEEGLPEEERGYDLVFVDANKDEYFEYFTEGLRLVRKGGILVFDNAVRGGRIGVPDGYEVDEDTAGLRKIFDWIEKDKGKTVIASTIQTVGGKSWDGFAVVYKQ